jgi:hypothetical protein
MTPHVFFFGGGGGGLYIPFLFYYGPSKQKAKKHSTGGHVRYNLDLGDGLGKSKIAPESYIFFAIFNTVIPPSESRGQIGPSVTDATLTPNQDCY